MVTVAGEDRDADGQLWRNVTDDDERSGWVVAEALEPAPQREPGVPITIARAPTPSVGSDNPVADQAAPCRLGQIKGDSTAGLYYQPPHRQYGSIRERVRCFDGEAQARASGFQPAP